MSKTESDDEAFPMDLYRAEQVRATDRYVIDELGIPGLVLMKKAGAAAFACLREQWPAANSLSVVCGAGNNAGDGFVVARLGLEADMVVRVFTLVAVAQLSGDALKAAQEFQAAGGVVEGFDAAGFEAGDVVVDALLGTGLDRAVGGRYAEAIGTVNRCGRPVLALDIPSGLHADTGCVLGCAVKAALTVTFIALKQGLFTGEAADHCGRLRFAALEVPEAVRRRQPMSASLIEASRPLLPRRLRCAHKGHYGHVLVVGGEVGYSGAARLAAEAAARVGAGWVSVATRKEHAAVLNSGRPELMCRGMERVEDLLPLLDYASVVAVGPGLGQSRWAQALFREVCQWEIPLVVDADALNLLAQAPLRRTAWVLTPHPGEAGRLLQCRTGDIGADRFAAARALHARYGAVSVLKGAGSLIYDGEQLALCRQGNPGMASGGMGDVLTGVIASLIAQGLEPAEAARLGVWVHANAADAAARQGERGLLAGDLMPYLREVVNG